MQIKLRLNNKSVENYCNEYVNTSTIFYTILLNTRFKMKLTTQTNASYSS